MLPTTQPLWQEAMNRFTMIDFEAPISEIEVDQFLAHLPMRLPNEAYTAWIKRGQQLNDAIPYQNIDFQPITHCLRLAAQSDESHETLPEEPFISNDEQFRLTLSACPDNTLKLTLQALGFACDDYANCTMGIAVGNDKEDLIAVIHLDEDGDGVSDTLDDTPAIRLALRTLVIALIERKNA